MARGLLAAEQPAVVIVQEFGLLCEEAAVVREAQDAGMPCLMLPSADNGQVPLSSLQGFIASPRAAHVTLRRPLNRLVGWLFPDWVRRYREVAMLRYPAPRSLGYWCAGLMRGDPWLPHSDVRNRAVLCERARLDILREQRGNPSRLTVTGQPAMDEMYRLWRLDAPARQTLRYRLGLEEGRAIALFSIPPLVLHGILTPEAQAALVRTVLEAIAHVPNVQAIVTTYQGDDAPSYQALAQRWGARLARDIDVRQLIAAADVVINIRSSITWASIACRRPVIAVDFWNLGPVSYYECPGVRLVYDSKELAMALEAWLGDPAGRAAAEALLEQASVMWADKFDGHATERVVALAHAAAGAPHGAPPSDASPAALEPVAVGAEESHDAS